MDSSRVLAVQARLDAARDKLQAELDKGAARDKSLVTSYEKLVTSYEKSIEELKDELKMHTSTVGETAGSLMGNAGTSCDYSAYPSLTYKAFEQICFSLAAFFVA